MGCRSLCCTPWPHDVSSREEFLSFWRILRFSRFCPSRTTWVEPRNPLELHPWRIQPEVCLQNRQDSRWLHPWKGRHFGSCLLPLGWWIVTLYHVQRLSRTRRKHFCSRYYFFIFLHLNQIKKWHQKSVMFAYARNDGSDEATTTRFQQWWHDFNNDD